jgi:hypothetical protein
MDQQIMVEMEKDYEKNKNTMDITPTMYMGKSISIDLRNVKTHFNALNYSNLDNILSVICYHLGLIIVSRIPTYLHLSMDTERIDDDYVDGVEVCGMYLLFILQDGSRISIRTFPKERFAIFDMYISFTEKSDIYTMNEYYYEVYDFLTMKFRCDVSSNAINIIDRCYPIV